MDYLYFAFAAVLILVIVFAFVFSERAKEKPTPRLSQKPKSPGNREQSPGKKPEARPTNPNGGRYIPSYQSNPEAVKHIERFLNGFAARNDKSTPEKQNAADEILLSNNGREHPAGRKKGKKAVKAQEPVQLELGIEKTNDDFLTVNE